MVLALEPIPVWSARGLEADLRPALLRRGNQMNVLPIHTRIMMIAETLDLIAISADLANLDQLALDLQREAEVLIDISEELRP